MAKSQAKDRQRRLVAPEAIPAYEAWRRDWAERFINPDRWERKHTEKIREFRLRFEADERAMQAIWSACVDRPWRERDIFAVHEIAQEFARVRGSVEIDDEKQNRVLLDLVDWARRGEAEFLLWVGHFKPFGIEDRDAFRDDMFLLNARSLFATRATTERFFQHHGRPFPSAWSAPAELYDRTKVDTSSGQTAAEPTVSARKGSSRLKPYWPAAGKAGRQWLEDNGCPVAGDGEQAKLEAYIADCLASRGHFPVPSTIRSHVRTWIDEYRESLNC